MSSEVILVGANPIVRLFDGDTVTALASVWIVDWSPHGRGDVLVLWHEHRVRVLGDNPELARWVAEYFTRHFPEAEGLAWDGGEVEPVPVTVDLDLTTGMTVTAANVTVTASKVLDRRTFTTGDFALDGRPHGLSLLLAPVATAAIRIDGEPVPGSVRREGTAQRPSSSAFLTAAEVWTRPLTD